MDIPSFDTKLFACRCLHSSRALSPDPGALGEGRDKHALSETSVRLKVHAAHLPRVAAFNARANLEEKAPQTVCKLIVFSMGCVCVLFEALNLCCGSFVEVTVFERETDVPVHLAGQARPVGQGNLLSLNVT